MKSVVLSIFFLQLIPFAGSGQVSNEDLKTMRILGDLERESRPFRSGSVGPEVEGDPYLWDRWSPGSVTLYRDSKKFELPSLKFDVLNYGIDVLFDEKSIKSLDGNLVKALDYRDSLTKMPHSFVNAKEFTRDGVPIRGFLEVLCQGKVDVYAYVEATLLKPNYNVAIGSGNANYKISKKRTLFYSLDTELRPMNKKELSKIWKEREKDMAKYEKVNNLNLSRERDLMLMVDYYNTL